MTPSITALATSLFALVLSTAVASAAEPGPRVVDEGGVRDRWMLAEGSTLASPALPRAATQGARNVCIALGYTIAPDGKTSDFRVLKHWNSQSGDATEPFDGFWLDYARAGTAAVEAWRFAPRPGVAAPVATTTVATLTWQAQPGTDAIALRARCRIDGLAAFLERTRRESLTNRQVDSDNRMRERALRKQAGTPKNKPTIRQ